MRSAALFGLLLLTARTYAQQDNEIAVAVSPGAPDTIFPNSATTHGWQFTVNTKIVVSHLGLYDRLQDGFAMGHLMALWNESGSVIATAKMHPGTGAMLIDNFRYTGITDLGFAAGSAIGGSSGQLRVTLTPGTTYTIGFYSALFNQQDGMVIFNGFHTVNPWIDYVGFGVSDFTSPLEMPTSVDDSGLHRWGPSFLFTVPSGCPGDVDNDRVVGGADLLQVVGNMGSCGDACAADITGDGVVDFADIVVLVDNLGPCEEESRAQFASGAVEASD